MEILEVTKCPVCGGLVEVASPKVGIEVECPDCGEVLKITSVHPFKLYYALASDLEPLPEPDEHRLPPLG
jgi:rRNA maturation protein Nop10